MRKTPLKIAGALLTVGFIVGCSKQPPSDIEKTAYEWEKAFMDSDYNKEQQLLYKKGSYEVDKTAKKEESGLKSKDISYEIYYDKENGWYDVLTTYENPQKGNKVEDNLVIRKKDDSWKVDTDKSRDLSRESVANKLTRTACINCKK